MILLKSKAELDTMRKAGRILAGIIKELKKIITLGTSTIEVDRYAQDLLRKENAVSAFKGYRGYPATVCTSINEEIVHGIPGERKLKDGDIISLDMGIQYEGYFSDAAVTLPVGEVSAQAKRLIDVTRRALSEGIKKAHVQNQLSDISYAVQEYVEKNGFSVVRQFVGHGIGSQLHEEPEVPNFGRPHQGPVLKNGMVLAIEPMVNMGGWESQILENGWTAVTKDGLPSAHFEHTVAITETGPEILTA
ncbi:MAG: type I methionyl aminopeptidase [Candidatus Omnitrophica bacterium]|nr:type I methionyl aminopeptidase [Candidatus Omnitrophota bacterium]MBL7210532.1 type I methionyl aminopeptidase [Candidatus Omnitrophota bacterium]